MQLSKGFQPENFSKGIKFPIPNSNYQLNYSKHSTGMCKLSNHIFCLSHTKFEFFFQPYALHLTMTLSKSRSDTTKASYIKTQMGADMKKG